MLLKLYICNANLKYFTRNFKYEDAKLWNNLDTYIKLARSITILKHRYPKKYFKVLFMLYYYSF